MTHDQTILSALRNQAIQTITIVDARHTLPRNDKGAKWGTRDWGQVKGAVVHQSLWGQSKAADSDRDGVIKIARDHTAATNHLSPGIARESIAYTFAVTYNGEIWLCNTLNARTWSHGDAKTPGDENALYCGIVVCGSFKHPHNPDPKASDPSPKQVAALEHLWSTLKRQNSWPDTAIYGHFDFGKDACPGSYLEAWVKQQRTDSPPSTGAAKKGFETFRERQQVLKTLGYYTGQVDGIWGAKSEAAVKAFQKNYRLTVDGIWGPVTNQTAIQAMDQIAGQ